MKETHAGPTESVPLQRRRRLKLVMTLGGLALLAGMIFWVGPATLWARLRGIAPGYLAGAVAAIIAATLLSAVNSFLICNASRFMGFLQYLRAFWIAWAIGLVVPGQVGDVLTLTQVLRRHGMPLSQSIARTSVDKMISLVCTLFVASQLFRIRDAAVLRQLSLGAVVLLVGIVVAVSASLWLLQAVRRLSLTNRWVVGALTTAAEMARVVSARPALLLFNVALSLVKIGLTGLSYWLVIRGLTGTSPPWSSVTIAAVSSGLIAYLPLSANGIGTVEIAATGILGYIGIAADVVLSMYVLLRLANLLLAWIPAAFMLPDLLRRRKN